MNISRRGFLKLGCVFGASCLIVGYPVMIEPHIIMMNRYRIPVAHLPESFRGFTIVHLTDIHYGPLLPLSMVEEIVHRVHRVKKDLIVCTGDFVHERNAVDQIDGVWPILSRLSSKTGVFSVLGNHDHWADTERSQYWLDRTGQNARHQIKAVDRGNQRVWFVGAGDLWEDHEPLDRLLKKIPSEDCRIVLAHNPDTADTQFDGRVDLMLCGHTHGGQINIPLVGPPILPVRNKSY